MDKDKDTSASEQIKFKGKYFYGTGRRKNAVARVRVYPEAADKPVILVNKKSYQVYLKPMRIPVHI